jgi:gas vesicle protein
MKSILIILVLLAIGAGVVVYLIKKGKIKDEDGDFIPDVIEDKVEDVKEIAKEVKARAKRVKEELKDVTDALKDVAAQSKDVVSAAKGGARKGRKPAPTKETTIKSAEK